MALHKKNTMILSALHWVPPNLVDIETKTRNIWSALACITSRATYQKTKTQHPYTVRHLAKPTRNRSFVSSLNNLVKKSPGKMNEIVVEPVDPTNESTDERY
jgi:Na+-transporting NADH:ubiquinone oxidoreductase subunit NqrC